MSSRELQRFVRGMVRLKKPGIFYVELYPPHASRLRLKNHVLTVRYPTEGITDRITLPPEEGLEKRPDDTQVP